MRQTRRIPEPTRSQPASHGGAGNGGWHCPAVEVRQDGENDGPSVSRVPGGILEILVMMPG